MTKDFVNYANVDDFYVNNRNIYRIWLREGKCTFFTQWKEKFIFQILVVQRCQVTLASPLKELAYIHQLLSVVISRPSGSQGIINRQGAKDSRVGFITEMRSWLNLPTRSEFSLNICRFSLIYQRFKKKICSQASTYFLQKLRSRIQPQALQRQRQ